MTADRDALQQRLAARLEMPRQSIADSLVALVANGESPKPPLATKIARDLLVLRAAWATAQEDSASPSDVAPDGLSSADLAQWMQTVREQSPAMDKADAELFGTADRQPDDEGDAVFVERVASGRYAPNYDHARLVALARTAVTKASDLKEACEPWENASGEPPDWQSPLHNVFVAGMLYSEKLLADWLSVTQYDPGDGSEDFDQDATASLVNILTAAGLYDPEDGRFATLVKPSDVRDEPVAWGVTDSLGLEPSFFLAEDWAKSEVARRDNSAKVYPLYLSPQPSSIEAAVLAEREAYRLPCDVRLPPATTIHKGCDLSTLLCALKQREDKDVSFRDPLSPPTSPSGAVPDEAVEAACGAAEGWMSKREARNVITAALAHLSPMAGAIAVVEGLRNKWRNSASKDHWANGEIAANKILTALRQAQPEQRAIADARNAALEEAAAIAETRCEYCKSYTGLPGGACENCMNSGLKYLEGEKIAAAIRALRTTNGSRPPAEGGEGK